MELSDSDFSDAGEDHERETRKTKVNSKGQKVRVEAKSWVEIFRSENSKTF